MPGRTGRAGDNGHWAACRRSGLRGVVVRHVRDTLRRLVQHGRRSRPTPTRTVQVLAAASRTAGRPLPPGVGAGPHAGDARYHRLVIEESKHHVSAVCTLAPIVMTRIAACWRNGERYVLRDVDGRKITEAEGRTICRERYTVTAADRQRRRRPTTAKHRKGRTGRRGKESTEAAPAASPSHVKTTQYKELVVPPAPGWADFRLLLSTSA